MVALKAYPEVPARRGWTIVRDLLVVVAVLFFVWAGLKVYDLVDGLQVLGDGVVNTGSSLQDAFTGAGDALAGIPVVGESLQEGLQSVGDSTGGNLVSLGQAGQENVHRLALLLGWLVGLVPILFLLGVYLPFRLWQMRELGAADELLAGIDDPERRRVVATRAVMTLSYRELRAYTRDPFGDLAYGRYDALVAAALDDAGVRPGQRPITAG